MYRILFRIRSYPNHLKPSQYDQVTGDFGKLHQSDSSHPLKDFMAQQSHAFQSQSLLRFKFDTLLAKTDNLFALRNIFCHVASSETSVLNMLNTCIQDEIGVFTDQRYRSHSLDSLQYFTMFLYRHIGQITHTLQMVKCRGGQDWPSKSTDEQASNSFSDYNARKL